ncbi:MAG TPA: FtsX-like permease family protein [Gemmatimonadales bacterium]|nr:FtsX-like permease family protein [Gemmatimonadales bacterium]
MTNAAVRPRDSLPKTLRPGSRAWIFFLLSVRNVLRNARRSLLTAAAMTFGLAVLLWIRALTDGAHESWVTGAVRIGTGHVAIQAPGFARSGRLTDRLSAAQLDTAEAALRAPDVAPLIRAIAPRLEVSGLASSAEAAVPARIEAVDPAAEAVFSSLPASTVGGSFLAPGDRLAAYVGVGLARRLALGVGSRMVLTAQGASGDITGQLVRVVGTFQSGVPEIDEGLVYVPIATARAWLGTPAAATTLAVLLRSSYATERVARAVRRRLPSGIAVLAWQEAAPELASAVKIDDWSGYAFLAILYVIVALAILNAVLMSVLNRRREFGVLQALGLTARETGWVVFTEGVVLSAASGILGIVIGLSVTWLLWRHGMDFTALMGSGDITFSGALVSPVIVPVFRVQQVLFCLAATLVIGVVASLYPARAAGRIDVAEAMKFDR